MDREMEISRGTILCSRQSARDAAPLARCVSQHLPPDEEPRQRTGKGARNLELPKQHVELSEAGERREATEEVSGLEGLLDPDNLEHVRSPRAIQLGVELSPNGEHRGLRERPHVGAPCR